MWRGCREIEAATMRGVNNYWQQLTPEEIAAGKHREFVGGHWEEIGRLQLGFMRAHGLSPHHRLLDVGCGAMRGGLFFVDYLDAGGYYGLDIAPSLIEAGRLELKQAGLVDKRPHLMVEEGFRASRFDLQFDFALAVSVFTHIFANHILRCLKETGVVLAPGGQFYASFFEAPNSGHLEPIVHNPGDVVTYCDSDPFHYAWPEVEGLAESAGLAAEYLGDWRHPQGQHMACFRRPR